MTALVTIRQSDAVHILADGVATRNADNVQIAQTVKAFPLVHLNAVIAARGPAFTPALMATYACFVGEDGYDALKANIVRLAREAGADLQQSTRSSTIPDFDVVVGGWSETTGPDTCLVCSHDRYGVEPWTVADLGGLSLLPGDDEILREVYRKFPPESSSDNLDAAGDGLDILKRQREKSPYDTGGHVVLTTVRRDAIETRLLHRWPWPNVGGHLPSAETAIATCTRL